MSIHEKVRQCGEKVKQTRSVLESKIKAHKDATSALGELEASKSSLEQAAKSALVKLEDAEQSKDQVISSNKKKIAVVRHNFEKNRVGIGETSALLVQAVNQKDNPRTSDLLGMMSYHQHIWWINEATDRQLLEEIRLAESEYELARENYISISHSLNEAKDKLKMAQQNLKSAEADLPSAEADFNEARLQLTRAISERDSKPYMQAAN